MRTSRQPAAATVRHALGLRSPLNRLPLMVFGASLLPALWVVFVVWRTQNFVANPPDVYGYVAMARSLLQGDGFAAFGSVLNRRGPLYPALIALVYATTGARPAAMQVVQAAMHAGVCVLAFDVGRRLYNTRTGLIAGAICACNPMLLRYVPDFHLETSLTFLSTLTLWRSVLFLERPNPKNGALFGVCAALGALTKAVVLIYPVAFAGWWLLVERERGLRRQRSSREDPNLAALWRPAPWLAVGGIAVAMAVVILPWSYRNYRSSGRIVLITTGAGDAFLRGYVFSQTDYALLRRSPYVDAENESNAAFQMICRDAGTVWQRNDVETDQILASASKKRLLAEPIAFVRKFAVQLFTFWYQMTNLANSLVAGACALFLWLMAFVGWRRARMDGCLSWPLFMPILCLNVSLAILLALGRYSVPILPALAILAAFGIDRLLPSRLEDPSQVSVDP